MYAGFQIPEKVLGQMVPKHLMTLDDVIWSFGNREQLVKDLRDIKALKGKRDGQRLVFLSSEVAVVAKEYFEGKYDTQLGIKS